MHGGDAIRQAPRRKATPGIGTPRERYMRWYEGQGREPYTFGRAG
jgi:hypothetical protein